MLLAPAVQGEITAVHDKGLIEVQYTDHAHVVQTVKLNQGSFVIEQPAASDAPPAPSLYVPCTLKDFTSLAVEPIPNLELFVKNPTVAEFNKTAIRFADRSLRIVHRKHHRHLRDMLRHSDPVKLNVDSADFPLNILEPFLRFMDLSLEAAVLSVNPATEQEAVSIMRVADGHLRTLLEYFGFKSLYGGIAVWRRTRTGAHAEGQRLHQRLKLHLLHDCFECAGSAECDHACCFEAWLDVGTKRQYVVEYKKGKYSTNFPSQKRSKLFVSFYLTHSFLVSCAGGKAPTPKNEQKRKDAGPQEKDGKEAKDPKGHLPSYTYVCLELILAICQ
jgi:hypothetical protein